MRSSIIPALAFSTMKNNLASSHPHAPTVTQLDGIGSEKPKNTQKKDKDVFYGNVYAPIERDEIYLNHQARLASKSNNRPVYDFYMAIRDISERLCYNSYQSIFQQHGKP